MNILSQIFGIFRQQGLVKRLQENRSLAGFTITAILVSILGGTLYGLAMGIGLGIDTSLKDAIKVGLIATIGLLLSIPVFWLSYRLLGREEHPGQVTAVPLTFVATVSIILAVTAPVVFMLSVLAGYSPEAVYIHIVIVDVALLVGLYLAGTLVYHSFPDRKRLIIPNVIGFVMMAVILVVTIIFLGPFLAPHPTFSVGTDRLKDGLGIGVAQKVDQSLDAAASADHIQYRYQNTNENGDLIRDYTVTRLGDDYLIEVHLHAVPNEQYVRQKHVWVLDGETHTDFEGGKVSRTTPEELASFLDPALPTKAFALPPEFASATWRAFEGAGRLTATGTSQSMAQASVLMESPTGKLSGLTLGSAERGPHAETHVKEIAAAEIDKDDLEDMLNKAIVLGSVDRSDATMQDYVQEEAIFVVRYPENWRAGSWSSSQRRVDFTHRCNEPEGCPALLVSVFDLAEGKGVSQYAQDLAHSLGLQPEYREMDAGTTSVGDRTTGVVEYLSDKVVEGEIKTTHHIEYIFAGQNNRYHLAFSAPEAQFETYRQLFKEIAALFTYLA